MGGRVRCARNAWHLITPMMIVPFTLIAQFQWCSSGKLGMPHSLRNSAPEDRTINEEQEVLVLCEMIGTAPTPTADIAMSV